MGKETLEIDGEVVDAIAEKVLAAMPKAAEAPTADEIAEKLAEKMVEKTEKTVKKDISDESKKVDDKDVSKEMRFARALMAQKNGDTAGVVAYNAYSLKAWAEKSNYQNETTGADGGSLVPSPEFIAEVDRLTNEYGTAARLATVRATDRNQVTLLSGTNEVSFTKVGEATAANAQKLTYAAATVALDKYILTIPVTSELLEDSAVSIWQDVTNEVARARAKLFDQLVFTDSTYGLLSAHSGQTYKTFSVGAAISNADADDFINAAYAVLTPARSNGRYFMHPSVWNQLRVQKSTTNEYIFGSPAQTVEPNINGYPVELVDVLPDTGSISANKSFAVFGDLSRILIHVKRALETKVFDAGVVKDSGGSDFNLITQDAMALRATMRVVPQTRFPGAFTIIGTGTVS